MSNLTSVALTVLELLAFNSHDRPLRTHKHTSKERIISAIHFVHMAEINIYINVTSKDVNMTVVEMSRPRMTDSAMISTHRKRFSLYKFGKFT